MRERGILFTGEMVRAVLAGTKTQTRRLLKAKVHDPTFGHYQEQGCSWSDWRPDTCEDGSWFWMGNAGMEPIGFCPYGVPGDRLWVRETWHPCDAGPVLYAADYESKEQAGVQRWYPGIHLRRVDARLVLEVTNVRVERLRDISEADARAEGVQLVGFPCDKKCNCGHGPNPGKVHVGTRVLTPFTEKVTDENMYRAEFACLWEDINGKRASWALNPWVWVVEFRRVRAKAVAA